MAKPQMQNSESVEQIEGKVLKADGVIENLVNNKSLFWSNLKFKFQIQCILILGLRRKSSEFDNFVNHFFVIK